MKLKSTFALLSFLGYTKFLMESSPENLGGKQIEHPNMEAFWAEIDRIAEEGKIPNFADIDRSKIKEELTREDAIMWYDASSDPLAARSKLPAYIASVRASQSANRRAFLPIIINKFQTTGTSEKLEREEIENRPPLDEK